jgi:hypothetical protein
MGKYFSSSEKVSIHATQVFTHINNEDLLTGIQDLSQCWEIVKRENRDYTEGM